MDKYELLEMTIGRSLIVLAVLLFWNFVVCPMYGIDLLVQDVVTILGIVVLGWWVVGDFVKTEKEDDNV